MKRLGILGSSFSVGSHHNKVTGNNDLALPFESWIKKHTSGIQVYNSACSGKGTELYLNKIIYLKEKYNINTMLIEMVNNRSMLNFKTETGAINFDSLKFNEEDVYEDNQSIWQYVRGITQPTEIQEIISKSDYENWGTVQAHIAYTTELFEFWGLLDVYQAIKLCKMLGIEVITWQKSFEYCNYPCFDELIDGVTHIPFGSHPNAHSYYVDKYDDKSILCDHVHFNDTTNEEMIRDFIAPVLMK
ncbi:hypothetical protein N9R43_00080 [bacterium]|nr:hypothetical protein [bacterium]